MAKKKQPPDPSPDSLIRDEPRHYRTADDRFEVQAEATGSWYLTDNEQIDDFGLPILLGPYPTLDAVKDAITAAREGSAVAPEKAAVRAVEPPSDGKRPRLRVVKPDEEVVPSRSKRTPEPKASREPAPKRQPAPKAAKQTWLDRLEPAGQRRARSLIELLERQGIDDPEAVVRADIEAGLPQVARTLLLAAVWRDAIEPWADQAWVEASSRKRSGRSIQREAAAALRRLAEAGADPADMAVVARLVAERTAGRVLEQATLEGGTGRRKGLPGWRLSESGGGDDRPERQILLSEDDLLRGAPARPEEVKP